MTNLKRLQRFPGVTPESALALSQMQDNSAQAFSAASAASQNKLRLVVVSSARYSAKPWELVVCTVSCAVMFPQASALTYAAEIAVVATGSASSVSISAINSLVDGTSSSTAAALNKARKWIATPAGWCSYA